eukprot:3766558-Pleurochrysis_carterae.AAC.1
MGMARVQRGLWHETSAQKRRAAVASSSKCWSFARFPPKAASKARAAGSCRRYRSLRRDAPAALDGAKDEL